MPEETFEQELENMILRYDAHKKRELDVISEAAKINKDTVNFMTKYFAIGDQVSVFEVIKKARDKK